MLLKNPDHRIRLSQIFQNEFVLSSSTTYISGHTSLGSNGKIKSNSNVQDVPIEYTSNSYKSNPLSKGRSTNNANTSFMDQNILQLPSALQGYNSSSGIGSLNILSDQNCIKSVNSLFIQSSNKISGDQQGNNSSSNMSDIFSPSHFTNLDNGKKSLNNTLNNTYNSNFFSSSKSNTLGQNLNRTLNSKTDKSLDEYSYYIKNDIFIDDNPIEDLLKELERKRRKPHPSKHF